MLQKPLLPLPGPDPFHFPLEMAHVYKALVCRHLKFGAAFLISLVIPCAHTHTVLAGAVALPCRDLLHPSSFSNPSFPRLFFKDHFCPALALVAAECKCFSAAKGLHPMDCQRATWVETGSPRGFGAAVKHQSTTETQPHHRQQHHPTAQISPDTVLKLLIKRVIKLLVSASTILEKRKR